MQQNQINIDMKETGKKERGQNKRLQSWRKEGIRWSVKIKVKMLRTPLVVQLLRICLLVQGDTGSTPGPGRSTRHEATKLLSQNC